MKREFIAFLLTLLNNKDDEFFKRWEQENEDDDLVTGGEALGFLKKIISNTDTVIFIVTLVLRNLSQDPELPKIIGSLPASNSMTPLLKIFLIDKTKVKGLINTLCMDADFQAKIQSFIPVNFVCMAKEVDSAVFDELRSTINNPSTLNIEKTPGYHMNISKLIFQSLNLSDLKWRRMIKLALITWNAENPYHNKKVGTLDYESLFALREKIDMPDILWEKCDEFDDDELSMDDEGENFMVNDEKTPLQVIMPEDSISVILGSKEDHRGKTDATRLEEQGILEEFEELGMVTKNFRDFFAEVPVLDTTRINMNKIKNRMEAKELLKDEIARIGKMAKMKEKEISSNLGTTSFGKKQELSKDKFIFPKNKKKSFKGNKELLAGIGTNTGQQNEMFEDDSYFKKPKKHDSEDKEIESEINSHTQTGTQEQTGESGEYTEETGEHEEDTGELEEDEEDEEDEEEEEDEDEDDEDDEEDETEE